MERWLQGLRKSSVVIFLIFSLLVVASAVAQIKLRSAANNYPQWRNQKQDALVIPQGGYVTLKADAIDPVSLDKAVLSTNETGTWQNETTNALLWIQDAVFGFDNFGTATYRDGVLYAPSKGDNKVYAVNATNGNIIWNMTARQVDGSPYIDGDVIYVGECEGPYEEPTPFPKAMALNKTNGAEIWHFTEPNNITWVGSPIVNGEYVYYTTFGSGVYALNKTNGNVLWNASIGSIVCSVAYDKGVVFLSANDPPGQYAFNATTGQQIWNKMYGRSWDSSPVIYDGMIVQVARGIANSTWSTYVLNETNGGFIREFEAKGSTGTPLVKDGRVFIPSNDWTMWAYDLETGTELWETVPIHDGRLQNYMYCSPAAAGGAIYVQALNGTFYAINETDGDVLWAYGLSSYGFGSPSIGDGRVFITNDGALYAFEIGPGSGDWPMFCQNNYHRSVSEHGVEYVRYPLTQPQYLGGIANTWIPTKFNWCNMTITSAAIAWRIYFFDSLGNSNATGVKIFYVNLPVHDIAVLNILPEETSVQQNQTMMINVTVANLGNYTEMFNVTLHYGLGDIGSQNLTLNAVEMVTVIFHWNTSGVPLASYSLSADTSMVPQEAETDDNFFAAQYSVAVVPEFSTAITLFTVLLVSTLAVAISLKTSKKHSPTMKPETKN
jgi:outer membrane protein assembly factor BamB